MLGGLRAVDLVVVFDGDTPAELIEAVQPDVLVKGGITTQKPVGSPEHIVGSDEVRSRGGKVVVVPLLPVRSTTNMIKKSRSY